MLFYITVCPKCRLHISDWTSIWDVFMLTQRHFVCQRFEFIQRHVNKCVVRKILCKPAAVTEA